MIVKFDKNLLHLGKRSSKWKEKMWKLIQISCKRSLINEAQQVTHINVHKILPKNCSFHCLRLRSISTLICVCSTAVQMYKKPIWDWRKRAPNVMQFCNEIIVLLHISWIAFMRAFISLSHVLNDSAVWWINWHRMDNQSANAAYVVQVCSAHDGGFRRCSELDEISEFATATVINAQTQLNF